MDSRVFFDENRRKELDNFPEKYKTNGQKKECIKNITSEMLTTDYNEN